jgi:hypothetical protein
MNAWMEGYLRQYGSNGLSATTEGDRLTLERRVHQLTLRIKALARVGDNGYFRLHPLFYRAR